MHARRGAIATNHRLAVSAGLAALTSGGNAFDAAAAAAAALAVTDPLSTGLGGDGFALCWSPRAGRPGAQHQRPRPTGRAFIDTPSLFRA